MLNRNKNSIEKCRRYSEKCSEYHRPVREMVERFVQSLSNANDSGSFDTSLEVKSIHPQRKRSKCLTELDRDSLMQFVKEFEMKQMKDRQDFAAVSPRLSRSPAIAEKHKIYENALIVAASTPLCFRKSVIYASPVFRRNQKNQQKQETSSTDSDFESTDQEFFEEDEEIVSVKSLSILPTVHEPITEESPSKSCRVLNFISSARKKIKTLKSSSRCSSRNSSPMPVRRDNQQLGCKPLDGGSDLEDDGISTGNISLDSSFEMQPPIVPSFKVTPPSAYKNPAYELAKILRGSPRSKRASISTLRRSISNPDQYASKVVLFESDPKKDEEKSAVKTGLGAAMIKNLDVICSRALPSSTSPFRRWGQSSFRAPKSTESRPQLARRPSSLAASENDVYTKSMDDFIDDLNSQHNRSDELSGVSSTQHTPIENGGVTAWGSSFEKLLEDPAGLQTFAEFLKKEFSAENIYFWTACERYRQIESDTERAVQAMEIFSKHLATGASEPVNVDSQARTTAEENLQTADKNLFSQAQKQIFNLMKFDSYQRFIRSDLYKRCLDAESKNLPLPYSGEDLDELLMIHLQAPGPSKLKKSASNAEDRRRKSLLPWHRKARCKSRDRGDLDVNSNKSSKMHLSGNTLKPSMANSTSDLHSSKSSLSSFDATVAASFANGTDDPKACCLCRVILCDGATTIVQTRPNETIRQLVERLLEKRGINYQFFDVFLSGSNKAIDLENPSTMLAAKEVQIEQRVAFKLDLPDPKVISVKSKPKKALCEVLKQILQKYNYRLEDVIVLLKDTHEQLDVSLPVTVADGQRLQIVVVKHDAWQQDSTIQPKPRLNYPQNYQNQTGQIQMPKAVSFPSKIIKNATQQSTLDEITNKVFNELLQGKVETHANQGLPNKAADQCSLKSEDCASESSSIFERFRRRDSNIPGLKALRPKKTEQTGKSSTVPSEDGLSSSTHNTGGSDPTSNGVKKPLIAKWKTGARIQVTGRAENHEEFLEGLKRAQRARLEDQRGTEINSELPDFLKDKENLSAASKLRKIRANLSPVGSSPTNIEPIPTARSQFDLSMQTSLSERPQPAPRLSITKSNNTNNNSSVTAMKIDSNLMESSVNGTEFELDPSCKGPPPLPPKPKILPIKPSNWGQNSSPSNNVVLPTKIPIDITRRHLGSEQNGRSIYLDQPSSSFV